MKVLLRLNDLFETDSNLCLFLRRRQLEVAVFAPTISFLMAVLKTYAMKMTELCVIRTIFPVLPIV